MSFDREDFKFMEEADANYSKNEELYRAVVNSGNTSAMTALEHVFARPAMWLPPSLSNTGRRCRIVLSTDFTWEGLTVRVTAFKHSANGWQIVATCQKSVGGETHNGQSFKLTQADLNKREELNLRLQAARAALPPDDKNESYYRPATKQFYCENCSQPGDHLKRAEKVVSTCGQCGKEIPSNPTKEQVIEWLMTENARSVTPTVARHLNRRWLFERMATARRVLAVIERMEVADVPESR